MIVQEMCIIPKNIVDNIIESKEVNILRKNVMPTLSHKQNVNEINLEVDLKKIFKTKNKLEKALDLYSWILRNVQDLELQSNGNILSPIKNINLLNFIKDVYSNSKNFSKDLLNLYKVWVSYINLPDRYIENPTIKNYLFPNKADNENEIIEAPKNRINKRKVSFSDPTNISKKEKRELENVKNKSLNIEISPDTKKTERYINKKFKETFGTPVKTRSASSSKNEVFSGHGVIFTKKKPVFKWINY